MLGVAQALLWLERLNQKEKQMPVLVVIIFLVIVIAYFLRAPNWKREIKRKK
jgi:hypothetical protein